MSTTHTERRPMLPGERTDHYIRTTGHLPPHWSWQQGEVWHAKASEYEYAAAWGVSAKDRSRARNWLRRHGR
ncbi:hypothetical protein ACFTWH_08500 [Streptomyces sp. NPDC057011]|uniref:hypothetical protein n=1 Tax=unclassified Streptomyces TaxID=2593676 RepID=UPI003629BF7E